MQQRLDSAPEKMQVRQQTAEHPFGTIKAWMGSTHFLTKTLPKVSTEMSLHVALVQTVRPPIFGHSDELRAVRWRGS